MLPNINNASKLTGNSSRLEILKALVDWIQKDEFAVGRKNKKNKLIEYNWSPMFPTAKGWDERIKQFSYAQATPVLAFKNIRSDVAPIIKNLSGLNPELGAMQTIAWGGLQKKALRFFHGKSSHSKIPRQRDSGQYPNEQRLDKSRGARKHGRPQSDKRTPIYMGFKNVHIDNS